MVTPILRGDVAALWHTLAQFGQADIVIRDGADSTGPITAVLGVTEYQTENPEGLVQSYQTRDFIVPTATLVFGGAWRLPEPTWQIDELKESTIAGEPVTWEDSQAALWENADEWTLEGESLQLVPAWRYGLAATTTEREYDYVDQYRELIRLHSVELKL